MSQSERGHERNLKSGDGGGRMRNQQQLKSTAEGDQKKLTKGAAKQNGDSPASDGGGKIGKEAPGCVGSWLQ